MSLELNKSGKSLTEFKILFCLKQYTVLTVILCQNSAKIKAVHFNASYTEYIEMY